MLQNPIVIRRLLLSLVLVLSAAVYLPGISGPFIFDDYSNLLANSYIKIHTLSLDALYQAAFSLEAGPLQRPISMLTFALNHYFSGNINNPTPYKLTNLGIHVFNGLLLFWMLYLIFARLGKLKQLHILRSDQTQNSVALLAFSVTLLWLVHPIQITSVLYVVQRMTELSATFTLAGLILYLKGRPSFTSGQKGETWLILSGVLMFGLFGMFSKENAVLLPVFIIILEYILFGNEQPWSRWRVLPDSSKRAVLTTFLIVIAVGLTLAVYLAMPGYASRRFSMMERLLTESRVLFFYISLILLPQINRFGHVHDDIPISTSLFDPWTTFPATAGIIALILLAFFLRKRQPLLSLGILWFFVGHLLESTIVALEIAHEHRNYLPSLGIMIALVSVINFGSHKLGRRKLWWLVPVITLAFAGSTYLRSTQWKNTNSFYQYEVQHHPDSARVQAGFSILLEAQGRYSEALEALRRAFEIEPTETGFLIQMHMLAAREGKQLDVVEQERTLKLLASEPLSSTTFLSIQHITECIQTWCKSLQAPMEEWLRTILNRDKSGGDRSFYYYALGICLASQNRIDEAIESFMLSHQSDPLYLHPLFAMASIYIQLHQVDKAEQVLNMLREYNKRNPHHRTKEIEFVAADVEKLKRGEEVIMSGRH